MSVLSGEKKESVVEVRSWPAGTFAPIAWSGFSPRHSDADPAGRSDTWSSDRRRWCNSAGQPRKQVKPPHIICKWPLDKANDNTKLTRVLPIEPCELETARLWRWWDAVVFLRKPNSSGVSWTEETCSRHFHEVTLKYQITNVTLPLPVTAHS